MSGEPGICPACGGENLVGARFCGACGQDLSGAETPAPDPAPAPTGPAPAPGPKRTMLGMMAVPPPAGTGPTDTTAAAEPAPVAASTGVENRTMLGMSPIVAPRANLEKSKEPDPSSPAANPLPAASNRTMLGMPQVDVEAATRAARARAAAKGASGTGPEKADPLGPSNRTMLGMAARTVPESARDSGRPSGPPAAVPPSQAPRRRAQVHFADASDMPSAQPGKKSGGKAVVVIGVLAILFLVLVGGSLGLYLIFGDDGGAPVRASIVPTEAGDGLKVEVPDAPAGTRVRFGGQELSLEDGAATFPLAADTLSLGDNELTVELVDGAGGAEAHDVTLTVSYRIRADVTSLASDPPTLSIVIDAEVGSDVTVAGEAVTLDEDGRGVRRFPIDGTTAPAVLEHRAEYRVELPDGQVHAGAVETRIPYATLQIDRPGTDVVTDASEVEIAGGVHATATLTIDGAEITTADGRFVHDYALATIGTHEARIVVRQPGRAPRVAVLSLRRVADLAAEAASFVPEQGLSYARIAQNPTTYRNQRIALEGRIYNINVADGQSVLQMLVRDCPRQRRCPLWVTYPQATDATVNDWVRVLGTVAGEQQFRSESDRVITVPRVDAQFILPARARH